jgi:hypothetical protein
MMLVLIEPPPELSVPGEVSSLMRFQAGQLRKQIEQALVEEMSLERRAHLEQVSQNLGKALE